ncbi:LAFE_0H04324g1_1 [Lachancea fermentati]|uniref:LAFE_0H04324g1_1 n=1 Tax=Lachancea fermentati TaxID=4955 RepID=A0A1G4MJH8_LACFM|nr:LAFE_0H04324g1_1 [Lachancea fermentati]
MAYATPITTRSSKTPVEDSELLFQFSTPFSTLGSAEVTEPDDATLYSTSHASTLVSDLGDRASLPSLPEHRHSVGGSGGDVTSHHAQPAAAVAAAAFAGHRATDPRHLLVSALPRSEARAAPAAAAAAPRRASHQPVSQSRLFSKYNNYLGDALSPAERRTERGPAPSPEQLRELERMVEQIWLRDGSLTEDMFEDSSDEEH